MYAAIGIRLIVATGSVWSSRPHPWCARITGINHQWGYQREFVKPVHDYTYASRKGKNTYVYFFLAPGLYEIFYPISWKHDTRYFLRVNDDGTETRLSKDEVLVCLKKEC